MIPLSLFNELVAIALVMLIYSIVDHEHRLYANIVIAFSAGILFMFTGAAITSNAVYDVIAGVVTSVNSPSIRFALQFLGTISFSYALFMAYEAIDEQFQEKEAGKIAASKSADSEEM